MAVIFWAVGGLAVGVAVHEDHHAYSDYDNYDNYGNHSDYSDYAERQQRRLAAAQSDTESAARELSNYKRNIVNDQLSSQTLKAQTAMRVRESELDNDAQAKIIRQIEHAQVSETSNLKHELDVVNELISKISRVERED